MIERSAGTGSQKPVNIDDYRRPSSGVTPSAVTEKFLSVGLGCGDSEKWHDGQRIASAVIIFDYPSD